MAKDYYAILGLSRSAREREIKQAYRKLSRELHPDKHKGDKEKEAQFKEVNEAYEVLSDPRKREAYDRFGTADAQGFAGASGFGQGGFAGFGGFDPSQFGEFSDIFESFFGGARRQSGRSDTRGADIEIELTIPFRESVTGADREISFRTNVACPTCHGSGSKAGSKLITCPECSGTGQILRQSRSLFGMIQQSVLCPRCKGSGRVPEVPCETCAGEGRVTQTKSVRIRIPAGVATGQRLKISGEGEAGRRGGKGGDLYVEVTVQPDSRFRREGDDIYAELALPLVDAVLGAEATIETVHGPVLLTIHGGTQPGQILRVRGKGMPIVHTSRTGDHYVTIKIDVPKKLSREERRLFEELKKIED